MDIQYFEKPYKYETVTSEINVIERMALAELKKNTRLQPTVVVYSKEMQYLLPISQFGNQEEAKQAAVKLKNDCNADFYIVAGLTKKQHPYDATQDQFWLNIAAHVKGEVVHRKIELHITANSITPLKTEQQTTGENSDVMVIKGIMEQENLTDENLEAAQ